MEMQIHKVSKMTHKGKKTYLCYGLDILTHAYIYYTKFVFKTLKSKNSLHILINYSVSFNF